MINIPIRFFIITFLWSWFFWLMPLFVIKMGNFSKSKYILSKIKYPQISLGTFGPAVGAIFSVYTINGKDSMILFLKSFFSIDFGWETWLGIFLLIGLSAFISWILTGIIWDKKLPTDMKRLRIFFFPFILLLMVFVGGGQEEIGWRCYIFPYFVDNFGIIIGTLFLGIIWSVWHIPLWFIPGTHQYQSKFIWFFLGCIAHSYFLTWVILASAQRPLSVVIAHGTINAFLYLFPPRSWIYTLLIFSCGILLIIFGI
jgi:membrane protease YdiL (CAAX protease family)